MSEGMDLVQFIHENTKRSIYYIAAEPDMNTKPLRFKEYSDVPRFVLPKTNLELKMSLSKAILHRRSCRNFTDKPLSLENLSKILWYAYGITEVMLYENFEIAGRPAPSAGALYPLEIYPVVFNVEGLEKGVYHYSPIDHSMELMKVGDFDKIIPQLFMRQFYIARSSLCIILSSIFERTIWKYGARGYRYLLLEAGHVSQNICLAAAAEGLGTLALGGFFDNLLSRFIGVDPNFEPTLYGLAIGYESLYQDHP